MEINSFYNCTCNTRRLQGTLLSPSLQALHLSAKIRWRDRRRTDHYLLQTRTSRPQQTYHYITPVSRVLNIPSSMFSGTPLPGPKVYYPHGRLSPPPLLLSHRRRRQPRTQHTGTAADGRHSPLTFCNGTTFTYLYDVSSCSVFLFAFFGTVQAFAHTHSSQSKLTRGPLEIWGMRW